MAIEIAFQSPPDRAASILQWETTVSSAQLNFLEESASPGPVAQAAGKSLNCTVKARTADTQTSVCILYGGLERIRDGVVALLRLRVPVEAAPGTARVRVDPALAVSKDLKRFPIDAAETRVRIRPN